jgi:putative component of toxin-antitoxin plasmid stabilization module
LTFITHRVITSNDRSNFIKNLHNREPASEWIADSKNSSIGPVLHAKIQRLQEDDLQSLIERKIVIPIKGVHGLYELRHRGPPGWRLAFYPDLLIDRYVLLYGFRKTQDAQKSDITAACKLAIEYIEGKGSKNE